MQDNLPYDGVFAIIPADMQPVPTRYQAVVVRKDYFGFAPCSSRHTPQECLADISKLTQRYTEKNFLDALEGYDDGRGIRVSATFKEHVKNALFNRRNVLEQDIQDVIAHAKRPGTLKAVLGKGKFRPRINAPTGGETDWLFE